MKASFHGIRFAQVFSAARPIKRPEANDDTSLWRKDEVYSLVGIRVLDNPGVRMSICIYCFSLDERVVRKYLDLSAFLLEMWEIIAIFAARLEY